MIPFRSKYKRRLGCLEENLMLNSSIPLYLNFDVIAACYYDDPVRHALLSMKFHDEGYHYKEFGSILAKTARDEHLSYDYIVPVPLHRNRENERGYNQTMLVAERFAFETGSVVMGDLLFRSKSTNRQSEAGSKEGRMSNMKGAFICRGVERIINKKVLLLDDVLTSGATMFNAASCIRE